MRLTPPLPPSSACTWSGFHGERSSGCRGWEELAPQSMPTFSCGRTNSRRVRDDFPSVPPGSIPIMEIASYITLVAVILLYGALEARLKRMERRAARLERKADLILDHLGVRQEEPGMERVTALLRENKKIQAIKEYREITDADLKEAKEAVERMDGSRG